MFKKIIGVLLIVVLIAACVFAAISFRPLPEEGEGFTNVLNLPKDTIRLWYTDESMTDFVNKSSIEYYEETNIRVIPSLKSGLEYIENIYDASISGAETPDLYIVGNDSLEKAYLSGVAADVSNTPSEIDISMFPTVATNATTYHDKLVAYPLYFETCVLVYNKTYIEDLAAKLLASDGEAIDEEEDDDIEVTPDDFTKEEISKKVSETIPKTFDEIINLANNYDAPQTVESMIKWDVSDVFYNYFFVGNSINIGGECGDRTDEIDMYNYDLLNSLKVYQLMQQYFYIEIDEVDYDAVVNDFIDGKLVFTFATTDIIEKLNTAKEEGRFNYEFGVAALPDINDEIKSRGMSMTGSIAINGYSKNQEIANDFAKFIIEEESDDLYVDAGKIPTYNGVALEDESVQIAKLAYEKSIPVPKMIALSNYWLLLENCMNRIWALSPIEEEVYALASQIMTQVTGEEYNVDRIEFNDTTDVEAGD